MSGTSEAWLLEGREGTGVYQASGRLRKEHPLPTRSNKPVRPPCSFCSPRRLSALSQPELLTPRFSPPRLSHAAPPAMAFSLRSSCPQAQDKHCPSEALLAIQAQSTLICATPPSTLFILELLGGGILILLHLSPALKTMDHALPEARSSPSF